MGVLVWTNSPAFKYQWIGSGRAGWATALECEVAGGRSCVASALCRIVHGEIN